jgi:hypothetical protein
VTSSAIRNNAVRAPDIRKNAVRSTDIKNNAVTGADVGEPTLDEVPSAREARVAALARTAEQATNSQQLAGRGIGRILGTAAASSSDPEPDTSLATQPSTVVSVAQVIPEGSGDILAQASLRLFGTPSSIALCWLESGSKLFFERISLDARADFPGASASAEQLNLVGLDDNTPAGDYTIRARCKLSVGTVLYMSGEITAQALPG